MIDEREMIQKLVEKSAEVPVLVDFWAPWCEPCKQLGPLLDKKANEAAGTWELIKINVDECRMIAAQFGIQSIPSCKLIFQGRLIGEFNGAIPEEQLDQWLSDNLPEELQKPKDTGIAAIRLLVEEQKMDQARAALTLLLQQKPDDEELRILLAHSSIYHQPQQAEAMLADVNEASPFFDKATKLKPLIEMLTINLEELPEHRVREYYLQALEALRKQEFEAALEAFFDVLIRDREYQTDGARRGFLAIFEYLGRNHKISKSWNRRFEMAIFS